MNNEESNNQNINDKEDEIAAQSTDANDSVKPADDGFKTGKKTHGLTWEKPMDEQAFDDERLSRDTAADEEGD